MIETLGVDGLRVRDRRPARHPGITCRRRRWPLGDAAGAGDACTAGFLDRIARRGAAGFFAASVEDLLAALRSARRWRHGAAPSRAPAAGWPW
ncbi:MAG: hypothetical protein U0736_22410 [Gemmataceae bacterium]